eukprot:3811857-Rhodomonas_salina.2
MHLLQELRVLRLALLEVLLHSLRRQTAPFHFRGKKTRKNSSQKNQKKLLRFETEDKKKQEKERDNKNLALLLAELRAIGGVRRHALRGRGGGRGGGGGRRGGRGGGRRGVGWKEEEDGRRRRRRGEEEEKDGKRGGG